MRKRRRLSLTSQVSPGTLAAPEAVALAVTGPPAEPLLLASEDTSAQRILMAKLQHVVDTRPDEALAVIRAWIADGEPA